MLRDSKCRCCSHCQQRRTEHDEPRGEHVRYVRARVRRYCTVGRCSESAGRRRPPGDDHKERSRYVRNLPNQIFGKIGQSFVLGLCLSVCPAGGVCLSGTRGESAAVRRVPLRVLLVLSAARFRLSLCLPPVESESHGIRPLLHGLHHLLREHHHHLRQRPKLLHHLE